MSSGTRKFRGWRLVFPRTQFWENPLMGWTSTRDPLTNLVLNFDTKEQAIAYAEEQKLNYIVEEDESVRDVTVTKKSYADNYKYRPARNPIEELL